MTEKRDDIIDHSLAESIGYDTYPDWLKARLEWFSDMRFGMIIHWAPYSQWDCCESWGLVPQQYPWNRNDKMKCWNENGRDLDRFRKNYRALNRSFNPVHFDPDQWADIARAAGMKYVTYTTKHHDGFCMWDTKTTDYRITHPDCPYHANPHANVVRDLFDAFRRKDMAISCYFSKSDWYCPWYWAPQFEIKDANVNYDRLKYPEIWSEFVNYVHRQIEELMTDYGRIDVLWLDGGQVRPPSQDIQMNAIAAMARKHQPGLIMADRTVGGVNENFITPEMEIPEKPLGVPWESCITLGNKWKYHEGDVFKPVGQVVKMLVEVVSRGGNLLLGVGPSPLGEIPREAELRLREIGAWLKINGEAIYGTRPVAPYQEGNVYFTKRGDTIYAIILPEAKGGHPDKIVITSFQPTIGSTMKLLGDQGAWDWRPVAQGFEARWPATLPSPHAWVMKFKVTT